MKKNNANVKKTAKPEKEDFAAEKIKVNKVIAPENPAKKAEKKPKKVSVVRRVIVIVLLVLVLGIIGVVIWAMVWGGDLITKITGGNGDIWSAISTLTSEKYEDLKTDENGRTNILVFGTSGYDMEGTENGGVHSGAQLTDSIMIISLDQETGDLAILNLPRDLKMKKTCTSTSKVNEIYWCNNIDGDNDLAGATAMMETIGEVLGMDFQYYAHVNWESLVEIVDALGGIKVTLDEDINDVNYTKAVYKAGVEYELDGKAALSLARARHGTTGGDFSRGNSQQKILIGIKDKIYEKNISLLDLLSLASALGNNLRTNLTVSEIKTLAHLTFEFDFDEIRQVALVDYSNNIRIMTTGTINGISYVLPSAGENNYSELQKYVKENLLTTPVVEEESDQE